MLSVIKYEYLDNPNNPIYCDSCDRILGDENIYCTFWKGGDNIVFESIHCGRCGTTHQKQPVLFENAPKPMQRAILNRICEEPDIKVTGF